MEYDLIVIGAGSAARDGARRAAERFGARVALVERTRWGGSCPNVACRPTKAYVVVADLLRDLRTLGPELGLDAPAELDLARALAWKRSLLKSQARWREELDERFDTFGGDAVLVDATTVTVDGAPLRAPRILIASGSRTAVPEIPGLPDDWLDHATALDLDELPASLLVLGGGPVGLEFAQIFRRFGSEVTLVQSATRISPRSDPDATAALTSALEEDGVRVVTGTTVTRFEGRDAVLATGERVTAERVLLASGRVPNVEDLDPARAGVATHRGGIVVDGLLRTTRHGIWAAGDVTGIAPLTPVAQYQSRIAVDDMFGAEPQPADYALVPTAIFTDPELGAVGLTEDEALAAGHEVAAVTHPVASVTRSQYVRERNGVYKVVFDDASRRVLGVHVLARGASDIVQGLALALRSGATVDDLASAHHIYPSWGEGVKAAAEKAVPERHSAAVG